MLRLPVLTTVNIVKMHSALIINRALYCFLCAYVLTIYTLGYYVSDDARISFAIAENIFNGFGPVYTPNDRVQVHSNPLWTYLLALSRHISKDYGLMSWALNAIIFLFICIILYRRFSSAALIFVAYLSTSNVLYSFFGSGLENQLLHLFVILSLISFLDEKDGYGIFFFSLALLTRLDSALVFLPILVLVLVRKGLWTGIYLGLTRGIIFWTHCLWTIWYYGYLLPTPYYAKVSSLNYSSSSLADAALSYIVGTATFAPIDIAFLLILPLMCIALLRAREYMLACVAIGAILQIAHIFRFGGDQMMPRLLDLPVFLTIFAVVAAIQKYRLIRDDHFKLVSLALLLLSFVYSHSPSNTFFEKQAPLARGVVETKDFKKKFMVRTKYRATDFKIAWGKDNLFASHKGIFNPKNQPEIYSGRLDGDVRYFHVRGLAGQPALQHGSFRNFDPHGLADPFLARVISKRPLFQAGHKRAEIPTWYIDAELTKKPQMVPAKYSEFYSELDEARRGHLFSSSRIKTVWYFLTKAPSRVEVDGLSLKDARRHIRKLCSDPDANLKCAKPPKLIK